MAIALLLHLTLAFPASHPLSPLTLQTAIEEAHLVWSPYGVAIDLAVPGAPAGNREILTIVVVETPQSRTRSRWRRRLGTLRVDADTTSSPIITVFLADILHFVSARGCSAPSNGNGRQRCVSGSSDARSDASLRTRSATTCFEAPTTQRGLMKPVPLGDALVQPAGTASRCRGMKPSGSLQVERT